VRWLARARREAIGLDPVVGAILAIDDLTHDSAVHRGGAERARRLVAESIAIADAPCEVEVDVEERRIAGAAGPLRARRYSPRRAEAILPGLVFFHGGGWVTGDLDTHDALCQRLAGLGGIRVVSVAYRLAPEHPFPAAVEDALAAFRDVAERAEELGIDPARIGIGGDSAGGNLSAVVSLETRGELRRPSLAVLLYPSVDATCSSDSHRSLAEGYYLTREAIDWYLTQYVGSDPGKRRDPRISPHFVEDLRGAPPTLVVVAGFDPLRDEAIAHAARLRDAGVPVRVVREEALIHGFVLMNGIAPEARRATEDLARRIGDALRSGAP
jgi:acetyl esterase